MGRYVVDQLVVLMAIKLVQPGMLGDVTEGVQRLVPDRAETPIDKKVIHDQIERLIDLEFVCRYSGRRYMLTDVGQDYIAATGIKLKLDARRMFLLKETRQRSFDWRSGTRDGSLKQ